MGFAVPGNAAMDKRSGSVRRPHSGVMVRRDHQADQRREHHERHHPRLQQRDVIADFGLGNPRGQIDGVLVDNRQDFVSLLKDRSAPEGRAARLVYCTFGSTSNWWKGGGEDSVHSSVVAPGPQGLSAA